MFNVFANCKVVKGHSRSAIYDLQRNELYPIPNSLFFILEGSGKSTYNNIVDKYGEENTEILLEYFNFLIEKEIIFFHDNPEYFPELDNQWDEPYEITNCLIDLCTVNPKYLKDLKLSINNFPIQCIQIRIFNTITFFELGSILDAVQTAGLNSIEVLLKYSENISIDELFEITKKYNRIFTITVFNSPEESFYNAKKSAFGQIYFISKNAFSEKDCGLILPDFFTINIKTYTESIAYNSCLNRKISVDSNGNIKNCPSMAETFGKIGIITFAEVIEKHGFKNYWGLNKDKINVCKQCEFRYICTDCRAYIEDPEDIFSKPLKCGYNPYIGEWNEWSENVLKTKAILNYKLDKII